MIVHDISGAHVVSDVHEISQLSVTQRLHSCQALAESQLFNGRGVCARLLRLPSQAVKCCQTGRSPTFSADLPSDGRLPAIVSRRTSRSWPGLVSLINICFCPLPATGCGLPPGPNGVLGGLEGVSYLAVAGLAGWGLRKRLVRQSSHQPSSNALFLSPNQSLETQ